MKKIIEATEETQASKPKSNLEKAQIELANLLLHSEGIVHPAEINFVEDLPKVLKKYRAELFLRKHNINEDTIADIMNRAYGS